MKERVDRICITCQYYKPFLHCAVDNYSIGYIECELPTKCRTYRLHENYRRGGKWYDSRTEKEEKQDA